MAEKSCSNQGCTKESCEGCPSKKTSFLVDQNIYSNVRHVIGVVSGKGGVGKSMVTATLANRMTEKGFRVGILDADITGPSIPKMYGLHGPAVADDNGIIPVVTENGIKVMSLNLLVPNEEDPVIWRGPVIANMVKQFWSDVIWGELDFLFVDMPPGTGDVPLTVFQSLPVEGIVIVSSPQDLVRMIVTKAFSFDSITGAAIGVALMTGIKRGLFSNEAGMGAVPNAAAAADASHPVKQGLIQAMGVYFDTLFVCTASAMLVLLSPEWMMGSKLTGIALVQKSVAGQLGEWTNFFMTVIVLFFAFSSIIGNYFYGEMNMPFISKSKYAMPIFRVFVVVMVFVGSVASLSLVWDLADLFMALMAIVNLVAIFMLGKYAIAALRDYNAQKRRGILDPIFDPRILPDKKGVHCWPRDEDRRRKAN